MVIKFACRKSAALRLRLPGALGMAARSSEAGRRRDESESRWRTEDERRGRRSVEMRTAAGAARTCIPGSGPTRLLLRAFGIKIGDPGHPAFLRIGVVAEQESFQLARLSGGLSRPGRC